ncbi:MAG: DinB family protein [Candidatus Korobacteraceae bacterium]
MRKFLIAVVLGASFLAQAQQPKTAPTLKTVLLQELRETHNEKAWFVSEKEAAADLTGEQAAWNDGKNHSVGQLVAHLNFWNSANLAKMKHQPTPNVTDNDTTFAFDPKQWDATQKEFDRVMGELEQFVESADDKTLAEIAPRIARIAQHNAYHIGEMVTSRKKQGTWNPENGVKL